MAKGPFCGPLFEGDVDARVEAYKRTISRASGGDYPWRGLKFTRKFGSVLADAVRAVSARGRSRCDRLDRAEHPQRAHGGQNAEGRARLRRVEREDPEGRLRRARRDAARAQGRGGAEVRPPVRRALVRHRVHAVAPDAAAEDPAPPVEGRLLGGVRDDLLQRRPGRPERSRLRRRGLHGDVGRPGAGGAARFAPAARPRLLRLHDRGEGEARLSGGRADARRVRDWRREARTASSRSDTTPARASRG